MKLSLVLAAVATLAVPGLAATKVAIAPADITGVVIPGHRQPFKPLLSKNETTTHGAVNATGTRVVHTAIPAGTTFLIASRSGFKTVATAAASTATYASQEGGGAEQVVAGTDKNKSPGGQKPRARSAQASAGVPKDAGSKFKAALAAKKAKGVVNPPASWTKVSVDDDSNKKSARRSLPTADEHVNSISRRSDVPFGIKKGIVYSKGDVAAMFSREGSATWAYNWHAKPDAPMFQQIPMFWAPSTVWDRENIDDVMARVREGAPWVLGYNEPDMTRWWGCGTEPKDAYDTWGKDMFSFYTEGAKLVCPGITSWNSTAGATGGASGLVWLREFVGYAAAPTDLLCSAQAVHWYGLDNDGKSGTEKAYDFMAYVGQAHAEINELFGYEMPLWITEFAPAPHYDAEMMAEFLDVALPWLDQQDYVHRYSPWMADAMVVGQQLNVAGEKFVTWRGSQQ